MFEQFLGLPSHPLIVHAAVVLTPLLAVLAAVYALAPRTRPALTWAVLGLAVVTPIATLLARQSGIALKEARFSSAGGQLGRRIAEHESFGTPMALVAAALGLAALGLVYVTRGDRFGRPVVLAVSALTVVLALVAGYYAARAGHSGAVAVWGS
ncbi:DUF2231 domain-containing protein [Planobispora longispora]|uniref:Uncharacterized protein n=1 Tax=Planobispora longispora TaxID=28887 RepID=A0A8J3RQ84_9ACTN|nr:DUF2231 domain-containing protein [Planobispora longispora]GIH79169.1 hypothetical protein Plo01_55980 [Planobispora longispora]